MRLMRSELRLRPLVTPHREVDDIRIDERAIGLKQPLLHRQFLRMLARHRQEPPLDVTGLAVTALRNQPDRQRRCRKRVAMKA